MEQSPRQRLYVEIYLSIWIHVWMNGSSIDINFLKEIQSHHVILKRKLLSSLEKCETHRQEALWVE